MCPCFDRMAPKDLREGATKCEISTYSQHPIELHGYTDMRDLHTKKVSEGAYPEVWQGLAAEHNCEPFRTLSWR
jgi:hypothetical protein